jgi:hypothetical protein
MTDKMKLIRSLSYLLAFTLLFACSSDSGEDKDDLVEAPDTVKTSVLKIGGALFSIPSPLQTAMLIQKSGMVYNKNVLSQSNKVNTYLTDYARALNLGIYGADLGYVSLYNQTQDALGYLASVKQLSDKLGLMAAFDAATMNRIKNNITNKDSMMVLVGLAYRAGDAYLKESKRDDVSMLILAGGWIESMHFSVAALQSKPSDVIRYRIAEQKQALNSLVRILSSAGISEAGPLISDLKELATVYEGIEFKYVYREPVTDTVKKVTFINSETEVVVNEQHLKNIAAIVERMRNSIVNLTKS